MSKLCSVLLIAGLMSGACAGVEEDTEADALVSVTVTRVETTDLDIEVRASATVYALEEARIASPLTARIRSLDARTGDRVESGQILAELENGDLVARRREAVAAVEDARATLEKISAGTLPGDVERARAQVRAAEAALELAQSNRDRRAELYEQGAIPQRDLQVSQTELAQASASADVARTDLRVLEEQAGQRDIEIAQSRLEQAQSRLELVEAQLGYTEIRSPFAGTITEQFLFPGDMAGPDSPLFRIADLSTAVARAQVPEADARAIRVGYPCTLTPLDMPDDAYRGRVSVVNSSIDLQRRTVEVWCEIANTGDALRAGVFGSVAVRTSIETGVRVVPEAAVQFEEGRSNGVVFVVTPDGTAESRDVVTGPAAGGMVSIRSGLGENEIVIVEGAYGLPDGTHVDSSEDAPQ